jgi:hypothetical protein
VVFDGLEYDDWSISNYECTAVNSCPMGVANVHAGTGNVVGCSRTGATCTGSCTICEGGGGGGSMCRASTTGSCTGSGGTMFCGRQGSGNCGVTTVGGPNGCACTPPTAPAWIAGTTCDVKMCF